MKALSYLSRVFYGEHLAVFFMLRPALHQLLSALLLLADLERAAAGRTLDPEAAGFDE